MKRFPHKPALCVKRNGSWVALTWSKYYSNIASAAKSMIRVGVEPYHGVCVLGFNAPEWFISYMGGIMASLGLCLQILRLMLIIIITIQAGGIGCGIYTTNNPDACHYIADNCSANIIFAENKVQVAKILQVSVFFLSSCPHF